MVRAMFQYNFTKTQGRLDVALELEFADPWCRTVSIQNPLSGGIPEEKKSKKKQWPLLERV